MANLALVVYLIGVLLNLKKITAIIITFYILTVLTSIVITAMYNDFRPPDEKFTFSLLFKKIKRSFLLIIPCLMVFTAIPSERTMYLSVGLYAGDRLINSENEVVQQVGKTLNAKLVSMEREYLEEKKENGKNN